MQCLLLWGRWRTCKDSGYPEPPRVCFNYIFTVNLQGTSVYFLFLHTANPPHITTHPKELKDILLGQPVTFTIHATGTEPISYEWQWTPAGGGSEDWQVCNMESSHDTTFKLPSVQRSDEGSYQCVVSNCAGSQVSKAANLCIGKNSHFSQLYEQFNFSSPFSTQTLVCTIKCL